MPSKQAAARRPGIIAVLAVVVGLTGVVGCRDFLRTKPAETGGGQFFRPALAIESPRLDVSPTVDATQLAAPRTMESTPPEQFWDLTLIEALRIALTRSEIMRSLGGRVLTAPANVPTVFDPAIAETDPLYGAQGALSLFDPQWTSNVNWIHNDRALNNILTGGGVRNLQQKQWNYQTGLKKIGATGTQYTLQSTTAYDADNATGNLFPSAWDTQLETGLRQPLLQGAGIDFNRIAGPNAQPGFNFSNGVLLARVRADLSLADFEAGVTEFVAEVEAAYWNLYLAFRDFDSKVLARDAAWDAFNSIQAKRLEGLPGGEADQEAEAHERFLAAQDELEESLAGVATGTGQAGLYSAERRLRLLLGLPLNDGQFLRPSDVPSGAAWKIDWNQAAAEALSRRAELRKQRWLIKQRELELLAAKNFTLPNLDAVGTYRFRGFGNDLTSSSSRRFAGAWQDLTSLDHQEWQLGLEMQMPLGFRRGWAAVRHAELQLARERAMLVEQEREILHELGEAVALLSRSQAALANAAERLGAAERYFDSAQVSFQAEKTLMKDWSAARVRFSEARSRFFRASIAHEEAVKKVQQAKGGLLEHNGVFLNEGPLPTEARSDALELTRRWRPTMIDYRMTLPPPSALPSPQTYVPRVTPQEAAEFSNPARDSATTGSTIPAFDAADGATTENGKELP
ncbi:MAG: TolC family protein [Planctomycetales bacterium]|nr:TolC family protein [Planctomycetales bacterium]MBN8628488.1 TolC family protein [Planctomycetota bacterium]